MRVSLSWLKDFVDLAAAPKDIGDSLTMVGLAVDAIETVEGDTVFELDITSNRPDCLSHLGVARELSAIHGLPLRLPAFDLSEAETAAQDVFAISIADPDLCGRYCGRYIAGVRVGPSPDWMKRRLESVGVRPINNVADVTNYVLMELGQPLHAFDADTLQGQEIIVRRGEFDEPLRTLDGVDRRLDPSMLVIADANRAVALAGVMGGQDTEISADTKNVLLESAWFAPLSIRKTSRSLGLISEASYRFERGANIELARWAGDRAIALIRDLAGGRIYRGVIDVYPARKDAVSVALRRERIGKFLGMPVPDEDVVRILERLGFDLLRNADGWTIRVPSYRSDVSREEDLFEEIARHYGYDRFPSTLPPAAGRGMHLPWHKEESLLRECVVRSGYSETYGLSFGNREMERWVEPEAPQVELKRPLSEDASVMRTSLVPSILRAVQWNVNRGLRDLQLFELGKVYRKDGEFRRLVLAATGETRSRTVHETPRGLALHDLKGDVEMILERFNAPLEFTADDAPAHYHPHRCARAGNVAWLGELHPDFMESLKLRQRVLVAEIDVDALYSAKRRTVKYAAIPRFPAIRHDLSLLVDKSVRYGDVEAAIARAGISELVRVEPFDRMEAGPFPESKYSLAVSLFYQSADRTLTEDEVATHDQKILRLLESSIGAHLRE